MRYMIIYLLSISACDRRTDGWKDTQMDGQTACS